MIKDLNFSSRLLASTTSLALVFMAGAALAQEEGGAEDIVVTAQKREARLQNVPVSVTALSGEQLDAMGARDFKDILLSTPGVAFSGADRGQSIYNIRGVSTVATAPTVGLYLDDISLVTGGNVFTGTADLLFFDIERVEVLKGPQGTLYGGSSMGGAIKYVSRRPSLLDFEGEAAAGIATTRYGEPSYNGEVIVNIPLITDVLAVRLGAAYRRDGGFIDNIANGEALNPRFSTNGPTESFDPLRHPSQSTLAKKGFNESNTFVLRASALWEPDSSWSILPSAFYQDYKLDNPTLFFTNLPGLQSSYRIEGPTTDKSGIYRLSVRKQFEGAEFTSLTGYFDRSMGIDRDYSFFLGNLLPVLYDYDSFNFAHIRTKTLTQELRIASTGAPEDKWRWIAGLYYSRQKAHFDQTVQTYGGTPILGTEIGYFGDINDVERQYAAFGEVSYKLTPKLELTVGLRMFGIKQTIDLFGSGPLNGGESELKGRENSENGLNPKFAASYQATRDNLLFASASKGFRVGGPNRFQIDADLCRSDLDRLGRTDTPDSFKSDNLWTYEVGSKNQFLDRRLTFNAAAFYTDWKKIQQQIAMSSCGFSFTDNVGSARIKGAEIEANFAPTEGLSIGGTATYMNAKITGAVPGTPALKGDEILSVPQWMLSAFAAYGVDLGATTRLTFRADWQYQDKARRSFNRDLPVVYAGGVAGLIPNAAEFRESYDLANAQILLETERVDYRLFVNNVFDSRPFIDYNLDQGLSTASTVRPRTFGLEARVHF
ncbi:TonB-dependent receptor [Sphingosinicella microcystinivorans]|uniref:TonB-dependent receptor n=1 Tax=Sphingosinicella microcystinivorans TaxID=335406 RepID=UPI0022F3DFE7|nr:TonB-dependent receptor [Sphingosinicella microcystinivorans]WBX84620.1 TonB-dependent receptor [Sphingosinicella microcystinivorans]